TAATGSELAPDRRLARGGAESWVSERGPRHAYESLECRGGNGSTEGSPLARRYREQPVLAVWEGWGNVIALDVLRAMAREPESVTAFDAELAAQLGKNEVFDRHVERVRELIGRA